MIEVAAHVAVQPEPYKTLEAELVTVCFNKIKQNGSAGSVLYGNG